MGWLLRTVVALFVITLHAAAAGAQQAPALRVLHWNVLHSGSGTDSVRDRARQVSWMTAQTPDIITLNEVTESAAMDYLARLQKATGRTWYMHHIAAIRGSDGNAILSRFPMMLRGGRILTKARSVAQATIDVAGMPVNVFATHIESGNERASRAEQVQLLLPYLAGFAGPRIVNGDLNAGPDAQEIQPLLASHVDAWDQAVKMDAAVSYPENPPGRFTRTRGTRIDYILTSTEGGLRVTGCKIPDQRDLTDTRVDKTVGTADDKGVRPSDHNFVVCTMTLRAGTATRRDDVQGAAPQPSPAEISTIASDPTKSSTREIVLWAIDATTKEGWTVVADDEAAGDGRLATSDGGVAITTPLAAPAAYFDLEFEAEAGTPYRLWIRGLAEESHRLNDSVYVQFSDSVTATGLPVYRIGTTSATTVVLEEFLHAGVSKWGWADNGWDSLGPEIYFATTGPQTLRVQLRQDGFSIDQIVLSASDYLLTSPGRTKEDRTLLARR